MASIDKITDPTKLPGSFGFDVSKLNDQELAEFIQSQQTFVQRGQAVPGATPGQNQLQARNVGILQQLTEEQNRRQGAAREATEDAKLRGLFADGGGGGAVGPSQEQIAGTRRGALSDLFGARRQDATSTLDDLFRQQRGTALDEAAVTGNLRQPGFLSSTVADLDASRSKSLSELLNQLTGQEAQASLNLEADLAGEGLQGRGLDIQQGGVLGGLLSGESQFGRTFGLDRDVFGEGKRQFDIGQLFGRDELSERVRDRKLREKQGKKSTFDKISQGLGIANSIVGLGSGIKGLRTPRRGP